MKMRNILEVREFTKEGFNLCKQIRQDRVYLAQTMFNLALIF